MSCKRDEELLSRMLKWLTYDASGDNPGRATELLSDWIEEPTVVGSSELNVLTPGGSVHLTECFWREYDIKV